MHPSYRSKFLALESELNKLLEELSDVPDEDLEKKPAPGAWSILEIMQHMMLAEKTSVAYVKKKTSYPDSLLNARWNDHLRKFNLYLFLHIPIKVKAPAVVNESKFEPDFTYEDLIEDWREVRQNLMDFLESVPDEWVNKLAYRHSFAGRMTLDGMLLFFRDHFKRHKKQINRTLKEVSAID